MRFIDLCAGIGGFRLGFERLGFKCVYSCEIDKEVSEIYKTNFGEEAYGDLTKIDVKELPEFEILLAGFSCQPFSVAGKQEGFLDKERGTIFFDIMRIVEYKKPKVVVLENVKNLLTHAKGETFSIIREHLEHEGYNVTYKVLNAKDFGVAQNRERLIIVATNGVCEFQFGNIQEKSKVTLNDILEEVEEDYIDTANYTIIDSPKIQRTGIQFVGYFNNKNTRNKGVDATKLHLSRVHRQFNRIYGIEGVMCTLMSQESSGRYWVLTPKGVRKLTRDECKRLMGFPQDFIIEGSQKTFHKVIGNSICVPMVEEIAAEVRRILM